MKRPYCGPNKTYCGRAEAVPDGTPCDKEKYCPFCWLAINDPAYRKLWGLQDDGEPPTMDAVKKLPRRGCCG